MPELSVVKTCSVCDKQFTAIRKSKDQRFRKTCSSDCESTNRKLVHTKEKILKTCLNCSKEFDSKRDLERKYCSIACFSSSPAAKRRGVPKTGINKNCLYCGNEYYCAKCEIGKSKYCSRDCADKAKKSNKTIDEIKKQRYLCTKIKRGTWNAYRKIAFDNKDHRCELCGVSGPSYYLDVHHVDGDCKNNELKNLAILCKFCHPDVEKGFKQYPISEALLEHYNQLELDFCSFLA